MGTYPGYSSLRRTPWGTCWGQGVPPGTPGSQSQRSCLGLELLRSHDTCEGEAGLLGSGLGDALGDCSTGVEEADLQIEKIKHLHFNQINKIFIMS